MRLAKLLPALALVLAALTTAVAQPAQKYIRVQVAPQSTDWNYGVGENVRFNVTVLKNDIPLEGGQIRYEISQDMMPSRLSGSLSLEKGSATLDAGTMTEPGFLRCRVWFTYDGRDYEGMATAGFDPFDIRPTVGDPEDFDEFWSAAKAELAKVPIEPILTLMPERCTAYVDVYQVSLKLTGHDTRVYGILCKPKKEGRYPALLRVPGAGVYPFPGDVWGAEQGFITLQIGIHGIPLDMPRTVYNNLGAGALYNYMWHKLDDRDNYYYRRVYLGCVRAVDYLCSLPEWDGDTVIVEGGSQGGALSIVTAALDERITALGAYFPALCDLTGYLHGRAGGWPHMFRHEGDPATAERLRTVGYYDVVNFARRVRVPGFYSLGYNDTVCPPTSMFSAYNVIPAEKHLFTVEETGHYTYPEQGGKMWEWIMKNVAK